MSTFLSILQEYIRFGIPEQIEKMGVLERIGGRKEGKWLITKR